MTSLNTDFQKQQVDISRRAAAVLSLVKGEGAMFESATVLDPVRTVWRNSLQNYHDKHGRWPESGILASAHAALERLMDVKKRRGLMVEAAGVSMATSKGVATVQRWGALILPVLLAQTTASLCTFVDASTDETTILQLLPVVTVGAGDYQAGDHLDGNQAGKFASLNRYAWLPDADQPDDTKTVFVFDTVALLGKATPIRQGTILLTADGTTKRLDNRSSGNSTSWVLSNFAGTDNVAVSVDYIAGKITLNFSNSKNPPATGVRLGAEFDIDDEYSFTVPELNLRAEKRVVTTSRYQLAAETSVQAISDLFRESSMNLNDLLVVQISQWLAGEADVRRLRKVLFYNRHTATIDGLRNLSEDLLTYVRRIKNSLNELSDQQQARNGNTGFTGCYCGITAAQLFRAMPIDEFVPDPDYERGTGIRRAGLLFGKYDVYAVPDELCVALSADGCTLGSVDALFFGSDGAGHSPLVAGDAIAPLTVDHGVNPLLRHRSTVYGSEICAVNPFDGQNYSVRVHFDKI